jgi:MFS transporter, LPLT family, lysophospholipid transporter
LAITLFGLMVASIMWLIKRWHASNLVRHQEELQRLINIARNDNLHG